uniref:Serine/threonine-protein phosphatase 6 regulatory ankyrin repeat subunit C-like n=1 Tax=Gouania willdenowi TaxID=441366 RepID=A0A8C5HPH9_GOUWI
ISMYPLSLQSPLVQAIFNRSTEDVSFLLNHNEDVNLLDQEESTPLHAAAYLGDTHIMDLLISSGANINAKDQNLLTPLHRAAASRNERAVELLLTHGAKVNTRDKVWHTPLHMAAANWATGCAEALIPHVCSLDAGDRSGRTPLHHAAYSGHEEMVYALLRKGAGVGAKDKQERQPIHLAAHLGHVGVVKLLLSYGGDVMCTDKRGYTPLHAAAANAQSDMVMYLLSLGVETDEANIFGNTALHMTCHTGQDSVANELVNCGANINQRNYHGNTPLHLAAASSSGVLCLEMLVSNGADVNIRQNKDGRSALHMAAMYGRFTGSQILIQNGGEVDCVDKKGNTPLHVAARYGQELLVSALLTNEADRFSCVFGVVLSTGFDINMLDDHGRTCLHAAASGGNVECLNLLLNFGAEIDIKDNLGRSALHYATASGNSQCTVSLVRAGAEVNELDLTNCSPLHYAAASHTFCGSHRNKHVTGLDEKFCLDFLLENGANPTLKNSKGYSAVHYAAAYGNKQHLELVRPVSFFFFFLLSSFALGCEYDLLLPTLFLIFSSIQAYYGHGKALLLLCETLVSLDVRDIEGQTALHLAAQRGFSSCVEVLLKHQASYTLKDHKHKRTALHVVLGSEDCVLAVLEHGASALCRDSQGRTPLHLAASRGHTELLLTLLKAVKKADPLDSLLDYSGFTPTHWAAHHGHDGCLRVLLNNTFFSNQEGNPFTPLHCALVNGHDVAAELLVKSVGSHTVNCRDAKGRTPLHAAAYSGSAAGLQLVLDQGAEVNAVDNCGCSALMVAARCGQNIAVELLLHKVKPDLSLVDVNNNTALHLACIKGHEMCALLILGEITDSSLIDARNNTLQMPLHIAARKGLATVVQVLLSRGAAVMAVDEEGHTPALACAPNKNVAECLALILSTMKPFPPKEAGTGATSHFNPILKNCSISATRGAGGSLCHA